MPIYHIEAMQTTYERVTADIPAVSEAQARERFHSGLYDCDYHFEDLIEGPTIHSIELKENNNDSPDPWHHSLQNKSTAETQRAQRFFRASLCVLCGSAMMCL
jgi:hypothetical protein